MIKSVHTQFHNLPPALEDSPYVRLLIMLGSVAILLGVDMIHSLRIYIHHTPWQCLAIRLLALAGLTLALTTGA